jgi:hypothetical protein
MKHLKKYSFFVLLGLLAIFVGSVFYGGKSLKSIQLSFIGEGKEHQDKYIPGVNSAEKAPDYGIEVRFDDDWKLVGLMNNTFISSNTVTFTPNKQIPVRLIEEIRLFDDDPVENDILEVLTVKEGQVRGDNYSFEFEYGYSLMTGIEYFWHTAIGKALLVGITICILILFLSLGLF